MLLKIMHINHSVNCTSLNLQFVPVRRLYRLTVNRFSKSGTSSSFTAKVSRPLKHWTIKHLERTSRHNEAALRKHGRSLSRQHVKTIIFVSSANRTLRENRDSLFGITARIGPGQSRWESCKAHRFFPLYKVDMRTTQPPMQSVRLLFPSC